jgi:hypothetical protein
MLSAFAARFSFFKGLVTAVVSQVLYVYWFGHVRYIVLVNDLKNGIRCLIVLLDNLIPLRNYWSCKDISQFVAVMDAWPFCLSFLLLFVSRHTRFLKLQRRRWSFA